MTQTPKISDALARAREFEINHQTPTMARPFFHLTPPVGWMNDPNGFSLFQEQYHLFYQYHPYNTTWGPMHWGHAVSSDFISWDYLPCALAPDAPYDCEGCFSGSAIEHDGKQLLLYTGVAPDEIRTGTIQTQCIAVGDGLNYQKYSANPVITSGQLPEGSSRVDFRDPKIWEENGRFHAVIGSRHPDGSGQIAVFSSTDCKTWNFERILIRCENEYGSMWECPDFFQLDKKSVLLASPQDMTADGYDFHSGNGTIAVIGAADAASTALSRDNVAAIDYGLDFYAPQTLLTKDGRRIMIGWMQNWDCALTPQISSWSGMMSIPRELHIRDQKLIQNPVAEITDHYIGTPEHLTFTVNPDTPAKLYTGRVLDFTLDIDAADCKTFTLLLAKNERFSTRITYDTAKNRLTFDRSQSGLVRDCAMTRQIRPRNQAGHLKLRVLMDLYSIELFINDGEQAMTSLIFTPQDAAAIEAHTTGGSASLKAEIHRLT